MERETEPGEAEWGAGSQGEAASPSFLEIWGSVGVSKNYPRQTRIIYHFFFVPCLMVIMVIQVSDSQHLRTTNQEWGERRDFRVEGRGEEENRGSEEEARA